jgi:hypothetical protein
VVLARISNRYVVAGASPVMSASLVLSPWMNDVPSGRVTRVS